MINLFPSPKPTHAPSSHSCSAPSSVFLLLVALVAALLSVAPPAIRTAAAHDAAPAPEDSYLSSGAGDLAAFEPAPGSAAAPDDDPRPLLKPRALRPGDTIAFVAPAGPLEPDRVERARRRFTQLGYKVKYDDARLGRRYGYLSDTDEGRAREFMDAWLDPEVHAVFAVRGGYGTTRMMDRLDYEAIRAHPKLFIGLSDNTGLHLAIQRKARIITFHTPSALSTFGARDGMSFYTEQSFWRALRHNDYFTTEGLRRAPGWTYSVAPDANDPATTPTTQLRTLSPGRSIGRLTGGNLSLVAALVGTPYQMETRGRILFLEDVGEEPYRMDRYLSTLHNAGCLNDLAGVVIGRFARCVSPDPEDFTIGQVLEHYFKGRTYPVIQNFPVGHVRNNATIPYGCRALLDAEAKTLTLLEDPVELDPADRPLPPPDDPTVSRQQTLDLELKVLVRVDRVLSGTLLVEANRKLGLPDDTSPTLRIWSADVKDHLGTQRGIQRIETSPAPDATLNDPDHDNRILHWDFSRQLKAGQTFVIRRVYRVPTSAWQPPLPGPDAPLDYDTTSDLYKLYTRSEPANEITDEIRAIAAKAVGEEKRPIEKARLLYAWVRGHMTYKYPPPGGRGALIALREAKGDCGQYADLFISLCRAAGVPARFVGGFHIFKPGEKNDKGEVRTAWTVGSHAWAEILLPDGRWIQMDPTGPIERFFGRIDDSSHITASVGRNIQLPNTPKHASYKFSDVENGCTEFMQAYTEYVSGAEVKITGRRAILRATPDRLPPLELPTAASK